MWKRGRGVCLRPAGCPWGLGRSKAAGGMRAEVGSGEQPGQMLLLPGRRGQCGEEV